MVVRYFDEIVFVVVAVVVFNSMLSNEDRTFPFAKIL